MPYAFDVLLDVVLSIVYIGSMCINIYALAKCTLTDPGVIPAIPSENINKKKDYCIYLNI